MGAVSATAAGPADSRNIWRVIAASAGGTIIEWYDFYIFGSLSTVIASAFFPKGNPTVALLNTLAIFATGFLVRPFGALVFGRLGDLIGRKYAFLMTLLIMGGATTAIGLVPTYSQIGIAAPLIVLVLRLLQGLALGGEYGGAATYVAEHAPDGRRGFYTSFIQTTATLGLFVSLGVILIVRLSMSPEAFAAWGWRIPFLLSAVLLVLSAWMRMRLQESPLFQQLKAQGKTTQAPIRETFRNWKLVLLALLGATAGQAVVWYTGQFYALVYLQNTLKVDFVTANIIVAVALALGTPFFVVFGHLSDRIGRKPIMMAGNLIAALTYYPLYQLMHQNAGNPVVLTLLVWIQVLYVTMVYGPIAAFLVETFPGKIRYTALSLPYHLGNGWFGGLTPYISASLVASTGNIYAGVWYPTAVALVTFVVGTFLLKETSVVSIWQETQATEATAD